MINAVHVITETAKPATLIRGMEIFLGEASGSAPRPRGHCAGCHALLWSEPAYRRLPGIPGDFCSIGCIESVLFGEGRCRWCGRRTDKPYHSVDSRLCSENCAASYYAHVLGDRTARLGTGKRLALWLQRNQPRAYRQTAGIAAQAGRVCHNPECHRGDSGQPAPIDHLRAGALYCSDACKMQAQRSPNPRKSTRNRQCLCGVSSNTFSSQGYGATPAIFGPIRNICRVGDGR